MIKDRGNKKWVSLMLIEHRRALEKLQKERSRAEKQQPVYVNYQEMDYCLQQALDNKDKVKITYSAGNKYQQVSGEIVKCFFAEKKIVMAAEQGQEKITLTADSIVGIELLN